MQWPPRLAVRTAGRPNLLGPDLRQVVRTLVLSHFRVADRGTILLKDIMAFSSHHDHPWLDHVTQDLPAKGPKVNAEEVGGIMSPSLLMMPSIITVVGNLMTIKTGTS